MLYPVFLRQEYACRFLWILAFRNICIIIYLLLLIFYLAVWTPKTTFQTVENHLPYRASIFGWFCFFLLSTQLILLSNGEWVSVSVEPCMDMIWQQNEWSLPKQMSFCLCCIFSHILVSTFMLHMIVLWVWSHLWAMSYSGNSEVLFWKVTKLNTHSWVMNKLLVI